MVSNCVAPFISLSSYARSSFKVVPFAGHIMEVHNETYKNIILGFERYIGYANLRIPVNESKGIWL